EGAPGAASTVGGRERVHAELIEKVKVPVEYDSGRGPARPRITVRGKTKESIHEANHDQHGFYPGSADTSEKPHLGAGGVSWQRSAGSSVRSSSGKRSSCRRRTELR